MNSALVLSMVITHALQGLNGTENAQTKSAMNAVLQSASVKEAQQIHFHATTNTAMTKAINVWQT